MGGHVFSLLQHDPEITTDVATLGHSWAAGSSICVVRSMYEIMTLVID